MKIEKQIENNKENKMNGKKKRRRMNTILTI